MLGEKELQNLVRTIMPELYQIQERMNEWERAIERFVASGSVFEKPIDYQEDNNCV